MKQMEIVFNLHNFCGAKATWLYSELVSSPQHLEMLWGSLQPSPPLEC